MRLSTTYFGLLLIVVNYEVTGKVLYVRCKLMIYFLLRALQRRLTADLIEVAGEEEDSEAGREGGN